MVDVTIPGEFGQVFKTFPGAAKGVPEIPSFDPFGLRTSGQNFSDFFTNLFKAPKDTTLSPNGKQVQTLTPKPGQLPSGNVLVGGTAVLGTAALLTIPIQPKGNSALSLLLPPGSGGVGAVTSNLFGFASSPTGLLLIGGGILLVILASKK